MLDSFFNRPASKEWHRSLFAVVALFQIFYLWRASRYFLPLGDDGVVYLWPVGQFMAQASPKDFLIALISSFIGEDHLSPVNNFFSYLCTFLSSDPNVSLNIAAKVSYIVFVISSLAVVYSIWKDKIVLLFFFLFLTFNLSLTWRNMILPGAITLHMLAPLWCLFFLNKYVEDKRPFHLLSFSIGFLILTFSFETAFVGMPLLATYALLSVWNKPVPRNERVKRLLKIYLLMFILFLPYLVIHQILYGLPLPSSRTGLMITGGPGSYARHYGQIILYQMSEWLFGLPRFLWLLSPKVFVVMAALAAPLTGIAGYWILKYRLWSQKGGWLALGFLSQLVCILYTGRAEPGMWTLVGTIFCMVLADVLARTARRLDRNPFSLLLLAIPAFVLLNEVVQPFKRAETYYQRPYESSQAAYKAINEGADRIVMVRLPEAEPLMHPMAFWMGNKIYNRQTALWLYPEYHQLLFKNMNIESYNNPEDHPFSYFEKFLAPDAENREVVVLRGRNLFSRLFLDINDRRILRAAVIPFAPRDHFKLDFPNLPKFGREASSLEMVLTFPKTPVDVSEIFYAGEKVEDWSRAGTTITFATENLSSGNNLVVVQPPSSGNTLEMIEVNFPESSAVVFSKKQPSGEGEIRLATTLSPCRFQIDSPVEGSGVFGTLDAYRTASFNPLLPDLARLTYRSFETNRSRQKRGEIVLSDLSQKDPPLIICNPRSS